MKNFICTILVLFLCTFSSYAQADSVWGSTNASAQTTQIRIGVDISAAGIPSFFSLVPSIATGVFFNNSGEFVNDAGFLYDSTGNDLSVLGNMEATDYCDEAGANCFDPVNVATAANSVTFTNKTLALGGTGNNVSGTTAQFQTANTDGTFKVVGLETLFVPASSMTPGTTSGAAAGQTETSTNKINFDTLDFDTAADENAHFMVDFPKSWNLGTITFNAVWTAATGGTTGIALFMECVAIGDNVTSDTAYGTAVGITDDAQTGALEIYVTATSAAITIGNTPADDEMTFCRVFRDVSDANDDLAEDMLLLGINVFYTTDAEDDT